MKEPYFTQETRSLFADNYWCWVCHLNLWGAGVLVKIVGDSNSPLNCMNICTESLHQDLADDEKGYCLNKTANFLKQKNYKPTKTDLRFMEKNKKIYDAGLKKWQEELDLIASKTQKVEGTP